MLCLRLLICLPWQLKRSLRKAVASEDYKQATELKEQIAELQAKVRHGSTFVRQEHLLRSAFRWGFIMEEAKRQFLSVRDETVVYKYFVDQ